MMTDASETRYQQKLHPGVLCAVHPDKPFDFAEKAYWLQRDEALKAFVDQNGCTSRSKTAASKRSTLPGSNNESSCLPGLTACPD
jgi:hypothetical protein